MANKSKNDEEDKPKEPTTNDEGDKTKEPTTNDDKDGKKDNKTRIIKIKIIILILILIIVLMFILPIFLRLILWGTRLVYAKRGGLTNSDWLGFYGGFLGSIITIIFAWINTNSQIKREQAKTELQIKREQAKTELQIKEEKQKNIEAQIAVLSASKERYENIKNSIEWLRELPLNDSKSVINKLRKEISNNFNKATHEATHAPQIASFCYWEDYKVVFEGLVDILEKNFYYDEAATIRRVIRVIETAPREAPKQATQLTKPMLKLGVILGKICKDIDILEDNENKIQSEIESLNNILYQSN